MKNKTKRKMEEEKIRLDFFDRIFIVIFVIVAVVYIQYIICSFSEDGVSDFFQKFETIMTDAVLSLSAFGYAIILAIRTKRSEKKTEIEVLKTRIEYDTKIDKMNRMLNGILQETDKRKRK